VGVDVEGVLEIAPTDLRDAESAMGDPIDDALAGEHDQGLSDGHGADAELTGERLHGQSIPGSEQAGHDRFPQGAGDLLAEPGTIREAGEDHLAGSVGGAGQASHQYERGIFRTCSPM